MEKNKVYTAIGLMSGTSLDGVDAALIRTDGEGHIEPLAFVSAPYEAGVRDALRACLGKTERGDASVREAERLMTDVHIAAIRALPGAEEAELIGFHGQTIHHDPAGRVTIQIGDAERLAQETGIDTVHDFRSADVAAGGQGAPFVPLYHKARAEAAGLRGPLAVLNIGGVANVSWMNGEDILAFDTGPGNALLDDFIMERTGRAFDAGGELARQGQADEALLEELLAHPYFDMAPPKSLDRNAFLLDVIREYDVSHGAATLAEFTARCVLKSMRYCPQRPVAAYVTGGGRHNDYMMERLAALLEVPVAPVESLGWNGDALEAEAFAWLAVRSLLGLPLSLPSTTGVPVPMTGGVLRKAK